MIAVERHHVAHQPGNSKQAHAVRRPRLELHALFDFAHALQRALRHALDQGRIMLAVAFLRLNGHRDAGAVLLALECLLQARHQVAVPLDVGQRFTAGRAVDHAAVIVFEGVVNEYDFVCGNFQWCSPKKGARLAYRGCKIRESIWLRDHSRPPR
jgi:hypothetical protein